MFNVMKMAVLVFNVGTTVVLGLKEVKIAALVLKEVMGRHVQEKCQVK